MVTLHQTCEGGLFIGKSNVLQQSEAFTNYTIPKEGRSMSNPKKSNVFALANNGNNIKQGAGNTNHCSVLPEPGNIFLSKRIGGTVYHVGVKFCSESKETMQDKILRLAKNDLKIQPLCAKMELPQTGCVLEGGSLL
jgi:hypothetical protein